jgi:hypothetical protein
MMCGGSKAEGPGIAQKRRAMLLLSNWRSALLSTLLDYQNFLTRVCESDSDDARGEVT